MRKQTIENHLDFTGNFYFLALLKIFTPKVCRLEVHEDCFKVIYFFRYKLLKSLHRAVIIQTEKGMLVNFLEILRFSNFDAGNVMLFQIKVPGKNIKETTLARFFVKLTARPSFTR